MGKNRLILPGETISQIWSWRVHQIWLGLWVWEEMNRDKREFVKKKGRAFQEKSKGSEEWKHQSNVVEK